MKLNSEQVFALHGRGEGRSITAAGNACVTHRTSKGMSEVHEIGRFDSAKQARVRINLQRVPANMGRFHMPRKTLALARQDSQAFRRGRFLTAMESPLHAHANTQKRCASLDR